MTLILASTSSIRAAILRNAGILFEVKRPNADETSLKQAARHLPAAELALHLARSKALSVDSGNGENIVLGADQVLVCKGKIYDKPATLAEARAHLAELRATDHQLISALSCARAGKEMWNHTSTARLAMRDFSESFLDDYLRTAGGAALTSVGAYKLEHEGVQLFEEIDGDYFAILGLQLLPLLAYLRQTGIANA